MKNFFWGIWNDEQAFQRAIAGGLFILGGIIKRSLIQLGSLDPEAQRNVGEVIQALGVVLAVGKLTTFMTKGLGGNGKVETPPPVIPPPPVVETVKEEEKKP